MTYIVYGLWDEAYMLISGYGIYANFVRQGLGIWLGGKDKEKAKGKGKGKDKEKYGDGAKGKET